MSKPWHRNTHDAKRHRRKREEKWGGFERRAWTKAEEASLDLHVELLGYAWHVIARSMRRSPDALRNKLVRRMHDAAQREADAARAELQALVVALRLRKPRKWGAPVPLPQLPYVKTYRRKPGGRPRKQPEAPEAGAEPEPTPAPPNDAYCDWVAWTAWADKMMRAQQQLAEMGELVVAGAA
jgi:hypothetical protein